MYVISTQNAGNLTHASTAISKLKHSGPHQIQPLCRDASLEMEKAGSENKVMRRQGSSRNLLNLSSLYSFYFSIFLLLTIRKTSAGRAYASMTIRICKCDLQPTSKNSQLMFLKAWTYCHNAKYVVNVHYDLNTYLQLECYDLRKSPGVTDSTPILCVCRVREFFYIYFFNKKGRSACSSTIEWQVKIHV